MTKYKTFSEKFQKEEKEFSNLEDLLKEFSDQEDFSTRFFKKFGEYPSRDLLECRRLGLIRLKRVGNECRGVIF